MTLVSPARRSIGSSVNIPPEYTPVYELCVIGMRLLIASVTLAQLMFFIPLLASVRANPAASPLSNPPVWYAIDRDNSVEGR